jgi:hypothetical protein
LLRIANIPIPICGFTSFGTPVSGSDRPLSDTGTMRLISQYGNEFSRRESPGRMIAVDWQFAGSPTLLSPRPANPPGHWCRSIEARAATENGAGEPNRECDRISRLPPDHPGDRYADCTASPAPAGARNPGKSETSSYKQEGYRYRKATTVTEWFHSPTRYR